MRMYDEAIDAIRAADRAAQVRWMVYAICIAGDKLVVMPMEEALDDGFDIIEVVNPPVGTKRKPGRLCAVPSVGR